jgi:predicted enzyme related to lactoylglutathione lyase
VIIAVVSVQTPCRQTTRVQNLRVTLNMSVDPVLGIRAGAATWRRPMTDTQLLGRPVWYELLTTDMKAAEKFYTAVVGWTVSPFDGSPDPYDMWTRAGGVPVGGVMKIPGGMGFPPHWVMYVGVPKLEEAVARILRLGGSTLSPLIEVPNVGRMQVMKDPQGAMFAIHEPAASSPEMPEAPPDLGDASWRELYTTDAAAALKFYGDLFGWRETQAMDMGPMGKYHIFGRKWDLGGIVNKPKEMAHVPPNWGLYFRVDDVNKGADRVKANGGQVLNGPMEVPGGDHVVNCMDPQGAAFSLHHKRT